MLDEVTPLPPCTLEMSLHCLLYNIKIVCIIIYRNVVVKKRIVCINSYFLLYIAINIILALATGPALKVMLWMCTPHAVSINLH